MKRTAILLSAICLAGCYENELEIVTRDNASAIASLSDGRYCEAVIRPADPGGLPWAVIDESRCLTLTWSEHGRGWSVDQPGLGRDVYGVSARAMALAPAGSALGESRFHVLQFGPARRRIPVGDRLVSPRATLTDPASGASRSIASSHLLALLPDQDMFAVVHARLPRSEARARAAALQLYTSPREDRLALHDAGVAGPARESAVRFWLAGEIARETGRAQAPVQSLENSVRVFVRQGAPDAESASFALTSRVARMTRQAVEEGEALGEAMSLSLPRARFHEDGLFPAAATGQDAPRTVAAAAPAPAPQLVPPAALTPPAPEPAPERVLTEALFQDMMRCQGAYSELSSGFLNLLLDLPATAANAEDRAYISALRSDVRELRDATHDMWLGLFNLSTGILNDYPDFDGDQADAMAAAGSAAVHIDRSVDRGTRYERLIAAFSATTGQCRPVMERTAVATALDAMAREPSR